MPATVKEVQSEETPEKISAKEVKLDEALVEKKFKETEDAMDTEDSSLPKEEKKETLPVQSEAPASNNQTVENKTEEEKHESQLDKKPSSEKKDGGLSVGDKSDDSCCIRTAVVEKSSSVAEKESKEDKGQLQENTSSCEKETDYAHKENENIVNNPQEPASDEKKKLVSEEIEKKSSDVQTAENPLENKADSKEDGLKLESQQGKENESKPNASSNEKEKCTDSHLQSKPKDNAEASSTPSANTETESGPNANAEASSKPSANTEAESMADVSSKPLGNTAVESVPKNNAEGFSKPSADMETDSVPKDNVEASSKPSANMETESVPKDNVEASSKPSANTETESQPEDNTEASSKPSVNGENVSSCEASKIEDSSNKVVNSAPASADQNSAPVSADQNSSESNTAPSEVENLNEDSREPGRSADADPVQIEEVKKLISDAKEQMALSEFFNAADLFGKACEIAGKLYGDLAAENGELYYQYGCAMLECAKNEGTVLGEKLKDKEDEENDDGDDEEEEEEGTDKMDVEESATVENASEENATVENASEENATVENAPEEKENDDNSDKVKESSENGMDTETPGENAKESDEDEDSSLKTAWEMFELAKIIFEKTGNNTMLADTYIKLGEVGLETGHTDCVEDMKKALEVRLKYAGDNDRLLAETHFNIGLAYATFQKFDSAIDSFLQSKSMIEAKIEKLKVQSGETDVEIKELSSLLPDLDEKVQDMKDSKLAKLKELEATVNGATESIKTEESSCGSKPVSNITHLVKRKRKLEDVASDLPISKQACTEEVKTEESKE